MGIGTNNPVYTLDVLGIVRAGSTVSSSIYLTNSEVKWRGDGTAHFSIFNQNSTFQIRNTGANFEPGTAGSNLVTVTTSGNVGIGTTNPGALFQVNAAVINPTIPTVHIGDNANDYGGTYGMVNLTRNATPGDTKAHLSMIRNGNTGVNFGFYNNTNTFGIWHNLGNTGATPTISITTGNNVGIGTAAPVTRLDVWTGTARSGTAPASYGAIYATADAGGVNNYPPIAEFRHSNQTQGIAINFNAIFATGSNANQPIYLYSRGASEIQILGTGVGGSGFGNLLVDYPNAGSAGGCITIRNSASGVGAFSSLVFEVDGSTATTTTSVAPGSFTQGNGMLYCQQVGPSSAAKMGFIQWNGSAEVETLTILPTGRVGIGTTNPPGKLSVGTNGDAESMAVGSWSDRYFCVGQAPTPNSSCVSIGFNNTTVIGWIYSLAPSVAWRTLNFGAANYNFLCASTTPSMTISSTGINVPGVITNQGRPMSMVGKNNGDVSVASIMVFNAVAYNVGSMYNSSNGRWTASVAGYYQFTYSGLSRINTPYPNMRWFVNGNDFGWGACHFNVGNITAPNHLQMSCSVIIFMAVNDFVQFYVASDGFYGGSVIHNTACCIFLG